MRCSFCGKEIMKGTGKIYVKKEGNAYSFCSRKCEKNLLKLNRNPRETRWTEEFRKQKLSSAPKKKEEKNKKGGKEK